MANEEYIEGELVWAKLKGYPWWPAMIEDGNTDPGPNCRWVQWFGDLKHSKVNVKGLQPFHKFNDCFSEKHFEGDEVYKYAICKVFDMACFRAKKSFKISEYDTDSEDEEDEDIASTRKRRKIAMSQKMLQKTRLVTSGMSRSCVEKISWAREGFPPDGPSSLKPTEDIEKNSESDEEETYVVAGEHRARKLRQVKLGMKKGKYNLKDVCVGCGSSKVVVEHPLVEGGLCGRCKVNFQRSAFIYDKDFRQAVCSICSEGKESIICDNDNCSRIFCTSCVEAFEGPGALKKARLQNPWLCYLCRPVCPGFLRRREDWRERLVDIFASESSPNVGPQFIPPYMWDRRPMKVLSLYEDVATGLSALEELGIKVDAYYATEAENVYQMTPTEHLGPIDYVGSIRSVTKEMLQEWGPIDLLLGGSPCNDLSMANPNKKSIYDPDGSGTLFFEFVRILDELKQSSGERTFFWLYENVPDMMPWSEETICRLLKTEPITLDAEVFSEAHNHKSRLVWGNLPAMDRPQATIVSESADDDFEDCYMPVHTGSKTGERQQLICQIWGVPVIKHLLAPLKEYYRSVDAP